MTALDERTVIVGPRASRAADDARDPSTRLEVLLDHGTVRYLAGSTDCAMLAVSGEIHGEPVVAFAADARVQGGALGAEGCRAVVAAYDQALLLDCPIVGLWHSGGARLREGVASLHGVGEIFAAMTHASGRIPQISLVLGPAAGGAAYGPALTDVVVMAPDARVFVTGPDVVRSVTGEDVDALGLGGPVVHGEHSGVAHVVTATVEAAYAQTRELVSLLRPWGAAPVGYIEDRDLAHLLPESPRRAYDVHPLVNGLLDGPGLELQPRYAPNLVTSLGRIGGRPVGVIANNPLRLGGCLDATSAEKAARFVRMCDAFGVPLVVLVDVPGYLPGQDQEWDGVVRRGAKLLHAFAEATVPRVTLVTRKAYGGAYIAMNSRSLGATRVLAWPTAQIAVMGSVAAVRVLHRREIAAATEADRPLVEAELAAEHELAAGGLARAVELGVVDEVVEPTRTRSAIAAVLAQPTARAHHKNIPL